MKEVAVLSAAFASIIPNQLADLVRMDEAVQRLQIGTGTVSETAAPGPAAWRDPAKPLARRGCVFWSQACWSRL
jgi:hypothetical protein